VTSVSKQSLESIIISASCHKLTILIMHITLKSTSEWDIMYNMFICHSNRQEMTKGQTKKNNCLQVQEYV